MGKLKSYSVFVKSCRESNTSIHKTLDLNHFGCDLSLKIGLFSSAKSFKKFSRSIESSHSKGLKMGLNLVKSYSVLQCVC